MENKETKDIGLQRFTHNKQSWFVKYLLAEVELRGLKPFKAPINLIDKSYWPWDDLNSTYDLVELIKHCQSVDKTKPVILNADGALMDGHHRIVKAMLDGDKEILAVQFDTIPTPTETEE